MANLGFTERLHFRQRLFHTPGQLTSLQSVKLLQIRTITGVFAVCNTVLSLFCLLNC